MSEYRFQVGAFDLLLVEEATTPRPVAAWLPDAPPTELEQVVRAHGLDPAAVAMSISPLVIRVGARTLLVDTGERKGSLPLPARLSAAGVDPAAIDTVIITHGHMDHVAGILDAAGEFAFPNARYLIWQSEWADWSAADRFAAGDPPKPIWDALKAHPERIDRIGDDVPAVTILPGLRALPAPGHTVGQITLEITSGGAQALLIADAAHHWFQLDRPEWSPKFDRDKALAAQTRRALFERAARDHALLVAYHFPFPGVGYVVERAGAFHWEQAGY